MSQLLVVRRNGNLGGAVAVEDACPGDTAQLAQQLVGELLATGAADVHVADGLAEVIAGEPCLPARGGTRHHVHALLGDEVCQVERVIGLLLGGHDKRLAIEVGRADVLQCGIERDGGHAQYAPRIGHDTVGKHIGRMAI